MGIQFQHKLLHVAVGVIRDDRRHVLIARRPGHLHQGGLWEFPGGKVEPGETVEQALRRELREELAITVERASPLIKVRHDYGDRRVLLDVWRIDRFSGAPTGLENQPILWVSPDELQGFAFPAANRPIITAARLPEQYPIVDGRTEDGQRLLERLDCLSRKAYSLVQWRVRSPDGSVCPNLAQRAVDRAKSLGMDLLLNAEPELAAQTGAAGLHLTSRRLMSLTHRPLSSRFWVSASCHDLDEIRQAETIGVDFIVLSPVRATPSHPEAVPLGWDHFGALVDAANLPVYALGGMDRTHLMDAKQHGAQGISGIRGFGCE